MKKKREIKVIMVGRALQSLIELGYTSTFLVKSNPPLLELFKAFEVVEVTISYSPPQKSKKTKV